jgi:hypothetical protein
MQTPESPGPEKLLPQPQNPADRGSSAFGFRTARLSLRLILRWMGQGAFMLENLNQITAVDPSAAGRASDKMLGLFLGGSPTRRPKMVPRGMSDFPLGCRTCEDRNVAAPVIVEILDAPLPRAEAIFVDRRLPMEGID